MRVLKLCVPAILLAACTKGTEPATQPTQPTEAEAAPSTPAPQPPFVQQDGYLLYTASVVKQPTDNRKIKNEKTGKEESNWLATLYRGEAVSLLEQQGDWTRVRMSDGNEGWIKMTAVLPGEGVTVATVVDDVRTFGRPDFSVLGTRTLVAGSLLFVTKKKDETFSEVNYSGTQTTWVEDAKLVRDPDEVAAARVISRAKALDERKDESAKGLWDLAQTKFKDTRVVQKVLGAADGPAESDVEAPAAEAQGPQTAASPQ